MQHRLFHWDRLETAKNYATGDAVVMARDIDEARAKLREALHAWAAENRQWEWLHGDEEDRAALESKIEADVAREPCLVSDEPVGIIVRGSE